MCQRGTTRALGSVALRSVALRSVALRSVALRSGRLGGRLCGGLRLPRRRLALLRAGRIVEVRQRLNLCQGLFGGGPRLVGVRRGLPG
jgi:hypothetical protein